MLSIKQGVLIMPKLKYVILDLTILSFIISLFFIWQVAEMGPLSSYAAYPITSTLVLLIVWLRLIAKEHRQRP